MLCVRGLAHMHRSVAIVLKLIDLNDNCKLPYLQSLCKAVTNCLVAHVLFAEAHAAPPGLLGGGGPGGGGALGGGAATPGPRAGGGQRGPRDAGRGHEMGLGRDVLHSQRHILCTCCIL